MIKNARRIIASAVTIGAMLAGNTLVNANPAHAAGGTPNACRRDFRMGSTPGQNVWFLNVRVCWDPDSETYFPSSLEKQVNGQWVVVSTGSGHAGYVCQGTTYTSFQANGGYGNGGLGPLGYSCG